ncbi:C-terminal binding protein [Lacrimispora sp. JR3]|uniref:C-terminal binding protein n=1 Tax=Lacrimispora sinapis TaxID=3111456 RepID=UPI0037491AD1
MSPLIWIIDEEWPDYEEEKRILAERYPQADIRFSGYDFEHDLNAFGYQADLILTQIYTSITAETINKLERCKGIAVYGGGYDRVDIKAAKEKGIKVTNVQGYCAEDIADYIIAAMYTFNKCLTEYKESLKDGKWGAQAILKIAPRISETTLFIIGCGTIGRTIAERVQLLGVRVTGYDPFLTKEQLEASFIQPVSMEEGLKTADYVSMNVKYTQETKHLLKKEHFELMKPTAYFINTSRGGTVAEQDLIEAVREKKIAGACLDVITNEPPTVSETILSVENIIVTPHISYLSTQSYADLKRRTVENGLCMYEGKEPADWVNP